MLTNMPRPINAPVIDLTLDDSEDETSAQRKLLVGIKKKKVDRPLSSQGVSTSTSTQPSGKVSTTSYGFSAAFGKGSPVVSGSVQTQQQTANNPDSEIQQTTKIQSNALNATTTTKPKVEGPAGHPATPPTPKAAIVSPSKPNTEPMPASFFKPFGWIDRSPGTSSQKPKTPKKLQMPKQRVNLGMNGMPLFRQDPVFEPADGKDGRTSEVQRSHASSAKVNVITKTMPRSTQDIGARSENVTMETEEVVKTPNTGCNGDQAIEPNPQQHLPMIDIGYPTSKTKATERPQSLSKENVARNSQVGNSSHDLSIDKPSTTCTLDATAQPANVEYTGIQSSSDMRTCPVMSPPPTHAENVGPPVAAKSVKEPQTATVSTSAATSTNLQSADPNADVTQYLDRVGVEWSCRTTNSKTVIVVSNYSGATWSDLLDNVPNEKFSMDVNSQGELLVVRRDVVSPRTVFPRDPASNKPSEIFKSLSQSHRQSERPVPIPSKEAPVKGPRQIPQSLPVLTSDSGHAIPLEPHKKQLKRKLNRAETNHRTGSSREHTRSESESHDNSDYLTSDATGQHSRRGTRRRAVKSPPRLQDNTHDEEHPDTSSVQTGFKCQGLPKLRTANYPAYSRGSLLRNRDISGPGRLNTQQSLVWLRDSYLDTAIRPWKSWTGASKDIINMAWASDGLSFAVGSSTDLDNRNLQYNRSNNLLWCDMTQGTILELDDHRIRHPSSSNIPATEGVGPSSVLDPHIFTTISDIHYCRDPKQFLTASYDQTVKLWDTANALPTCIGTIKLLRKVDILASCEKSSREIVALAKKSFKQGVLVYTVEKPPGQIASMQKLSINRGKYGIPSEQAERHKLVPTALSWGSVTADTGHLLAIGYGERGLQTLQRCRGDIVLWDTHNENPLVELTSRTSYVYDLRWHTQEKWLAAAAPVKQTPHEGLRGTQSNIRIWEPLVSDRCIFDLDCLALDVNSIIFNPMDSKHVTAACTDGTVYHYDLRQPLQILAKLEHGDPIVTLDPDRSRESQDPGVQFLTWNAAGTLLYSGSSDGKIKQWNPALSAEDAFIQDIATLDAGISSGAFSPDFTNLLIGTNKGAAHVFSSAPVTPWIDGDGEEDEAATFKYIPARGTREEMEE